MTEMNREIIEEKAKGLIDLSDYIDGEVNIIEVARLLGFKIGNASLLSDDDAFTVIDKSKSTIFDIRTNKLIGVNCKRSLAFKRFAIAREIGNYCLHYNSNINNGKYAHRLIKEKNNEKDADYFASCLLMPDTDFISKYTELKDKISSEDLNFLLTKKFNVPNCAVENRINNITLLV